MQNDEWKGENEPTKTNIELDCFLFLKIGIEFYSVLN